MLEIVQYRNHLGENITFGQDGFFVNENDLRDFVWSYTNKNNRISSFRRNVQKKTLDVYVSCASDAEGIAKRNELFETCEKDVLAEQHGRFIIGDYYMRCYVVGSKKTEYLVNKRLMRITLSIVTDFPAWIKESSSTFRKSSSSLSPEYGGTNLDYAFDYNFDYASDVVNQVLINGDFASSNFRMIIYGPCIGPEINISGHSYNVASELTETEYIVIDSTEKTIVLCRANGQQVNCFNDRNRESYIFEKIPSGENSVTWDGDFGFDVVLLEERSEPKWT